MNFELWALKSEPGSSISTLDEQLYTHKLLAIQPEKSDVRRLSGETRDHINAFEIRSLIEIPR